MDRKLRDEDARVVDMLLDRGSSTHDPHVPMTFSQSAEMFHQRLHHVEQLLKLLDQMPVSEPPPNMVARTLDFIEQATNVAARPTSASQPGASHRPTA